MSNSHLSAFEGCYFMQPEDVKAFADTLADGFSKYRLFQYISGREYDHAKMSLFWAVSISSRVDSAICIADSKEVNSVLIYIPPKSKEPGMISYLKAGGLKMLYRLGLRGSIRLLRFDVKAHAVAQRHRANGDGYLMAFATRLDKQGQHYGKPLIEALLRYLDASGEYCYLETLKAADVGLYGHFSFDLKEELDLKMGDLTLYAMHRATK